MGATIVPVEFENVSDCVQQGITLLKQGRAKDAIPRFRRFLGLNPACADTWNNLGVAFYEVDDCQAAVDCYRQALALRADFAGAYVNLGNALRELGRLEEAVECYRSALLLRPDSGEAHCNLGSLLKSLGALADAAASFSRAIELLPQLPAAYSNLAKVREAQEDFASAANLYRKCMRLQPGRVLGELQILTMCPTVFWDNAAIDEYRAALETACQRFAGSVTRLSLQEVAAAGVAPPFNLPYHGRDDRPIKEAYAAIFDGKLPARAPPRRDGPPRIGVVATRKHERALLRCFGGVLDRLPADLGQVFVFCSAEGEPLVRKGLRNPRLTIATLPKRLDQMAETIAAAKLDVLYHWEVGTDAANYFLPFLKLAPIQYTSWGVPVTSGVREINYYLSSAWQEGSDAHGLYTERLLCLDSLFSFYYRRAPTGPAKTAEALGLPAGRHVYLCAQTLAKFHPDFDPILAEILRRDERGVVAVPCPALSQAAANKLRQRFAAAHPDVADRFLFIPQLPDSDYLHLVAVADVVLDTLHYDGATTMYDAFSLAQPVVTLPTRFQRGRSAFAMYRKMGLDDGIASDPEDYVRRAVRLATDRDFRNAVRASLAGASEVLFEDHAVVRAHEEAFRRMSAEARQC
ncbi:MAG TPA: tetratricopeptide repeat protein [Candidatus Anammoximicrobium sp.]|nr:tetratricopeptide repeat protein [Candidatus Anammoximicrobium sp.]